MNWAPTSEIFSVLADGTGLTRLTTNRVGDRYPVASPDGRALLFARAHGRSGYGDYRLYVMNVDGSGERMLVANDLDTRQCAWSPDGRRIVLSVRNYERSEDFDIAVVNADGSGIVRMASCEAGESEPHWGPEPKTAAPAPPSARPRSE